LLQPVRDRVCAVFATVAFQSAVLTCFS
jgi:hypothetical protein